MDKEQIARLKELAEKADAIIMPNELWAHCNRKVCADFIAAASPQAVLELIADIERLEKACEANAKDGAALCQQIERLEKEAEWLADQCDNFVPNDWREAARKAVEENTANA